MKKFLIALLIFVVLVSALPAIVLAAPAKPVLVVTPPSDGYQGDEFVFTVMVTGLPKAKVTKVNYRIQIFKSAVDSAWIATQNGQGAKFEDLGDFYLITWNKAVKKYKNDTFAAFEVGIKLTSVNSGQMNLLQTTDRNLVTISRVDIKTAVLVWSVSAPTLVSVNTKFDIVLTAVNSSNVSLPFGIVTKINFLCADRSVYIYEQPAMVNRYDESSGPAGYTVKWSGKVPAKSTFIWKFQVGSGKISCIDTLFVVTNTADGSPILSHNFRVQ